MGIKIGHNLKSARNAAGLTQEELAQQCGVATITIRQYESGKREPKYDTLERLANALDIPVEVLLGIGDSISPVGTVGMGWSADTQYDGSIRVHVSPEQREYSYLMGKCANSTITPDELRRLGDLQAKQPPLEESLGMLKTTLDRMKRCLDPLNEEGQQKVIERAEDYAQDLAEIPRYRRQEPAETPPAPQEGKDTTPPPDAPEGPQEGE